MLSYIKDTSVAYCSFLTTMPSHRRSLSAPGGRLRRRRLRRRSASPGGMSFYPQLMAGDYEDPVTGEIQDYFLESFGTVKKAHPAFLLNRFATSFRIQNLDRCSNPEALLHKIFQRCIRQACENTEGNVVKIGVHIESRLLQKGPIMIPFRSLRMNSPEALLHKVVKADQSTIEESLYGAPMQVVVSTLAGQAGGYPRTHITQNIKNTALIPIINADQYCLFYALEMSRIYATTGENDGMSEKAFSRLIQRGLKEAPTKKPRRQGLSMYEYGRNLMIAAGIPMGLPEYSVEKHVPIIQRYYDSRYPGMYRVVVFSTNGNYQPVYKGKERAKYDVCIYFNGKHFDGVRRINGLFSTRYYCIECERPYSNRTIHTVRCKQRCRNCAGIGPEYPCLPDEDPPFSTRCFRCNKTFKNRSCFEKHKGCMCNTFHRCTKCGADYNTEEMKRLSPTGTHECEYKFCLICSSYHKRGRECYILPLSPSKIVSETRFVAFDFESTQEFRPDPDMEKLMHEVNFACASVFCSKCIQANIWTQDDTHNCSICGPRREYVWSAARGDKPLQDFVKWILYSLNKSYKTVAFSHFGGRYDMTLVLGQLYREDGLIPQVIRNGNKLYEITVSKPRVVAETFFRDSFNLMPQALAALVDAYALKVNDKPFFPHMYNRSGNYRVRLDHLPDRHYYCPESFSKDKLEKFETWYQQNYNTPFYLPDKLKEYCRNDVEILKHALVAFRTEWMNITGDDVLKNSMTIASACMRHFRTKHIQRDSLALTLENGVERHDNQSVVALKYLKWYSYKNGITLRHRDSPLGEYRYHYIDENGRQKTLRLDGYAQMPVPYRPLAVEFHGCAWHGCKKCLDPNVMCPNGRLASVNYEATLSREEVIRRHFYLVSVWECEVNEMLKCDKEMKKFFENTFSFGPLDPRQAYFGGRTGPLKMVCDLSASHSGKRISYLDVQSLYPYTNYVTELPLGIPDVKVLGTHVHWRRSSDNPYKGLLKVVVLPPKDLIIPVIPVKFDERLLFPLCRTCAISLRKDALHKQSDYICRHTDEQRSFLSTITHNELNAALDRGYVVTYVDRVWTWARWSADVFKPYVRQFIQIKAEASGWPKSCVDEESKQKWIDEYKRRYNIVIDPARVQENRARKAIAKLCANSLWGRFSMRNNLTKTLITDSPSKFFDIIYDDTLEVTAIDMVNDKAIFLSYAHKKDFVEENPCSNIYVSLWTTSAARLILYEYMEQVVNDPDCEILYNDTDSIVFVHPSGKHPIKTGEFLGEMDEEYKGKELIAFYAGGCKAYALKWRNEDGSEEYKIRVRGITMNSGAAKVIHWDSFREQVLRYGDPSMTPLQVEFPRFELSRYGQVHTIKSSKIYRAICEKGLVDDQYRVVPFGYCGK